MSDLEALRSGNLNVGDGQQLYWEALGNPEGVSVLWLHGGPGSGAGEGHRHRIDPARQQAVTFDQRGCGRSRPLATENLGLLDLNTTWAQIQDIEALREHLGIDGWIVTGGSWGATRALALSASNHRLARASSLARKPPRDRE